jgi:hypothetical protein
MLAAALLAVACGPRAAARPTVPPAVQTTVSAPPTSTSLPPASPTVARPTPLPPTATPPPATATPLPAPAASPTVPATPDPNEDVGAVIHADPLDGSSGWSWGFEDEAAAFGVEDGRLHAVMHRADLWWRLSRSDDGVSGGDQQVRVTAHAASCVGQDEYGLIFRGQAAEAGGYDLYLLALRCDGAAAFQAMRGSQTVSLVDWTASPAVQTGAPADNTLLAWMAGDEFRFYANGRYLFSARDAGLTQGFYGFYLWDRNAGGLTVDFTDFEARAVLRAAAK